MYMLDGYVHTDLSCSGSSLLRRLCGCVIFKMYVYVSVEIGKF